MKKNEKLSVYEKPQESAQGMVEFALVLPMLILVLFGIIEVGRLLFIYNAVATSSREAARYGSAAGDVGGWGGRLGLLDPAAILVIPFPTNLEKPVF